MKKYNVLLGNYGSGKTELSINMSIALAKKGQTALVDMDIVNPYFRSSERADILEENGVRVIAPPFANTTVDVPSLGAEVYAAFLSEYAVFDAGGDPVGATALGAYRRYFMDVQDDLMVYYVVNGRRPFQRELLDAVAMLNQIQANARLRIDALINNTNLATETTVEDLAEGYEFCKTLAERVELPIAFTSGRAELLEQFQNMGYSKEVFPIQIYTRPDWLDA